MFRGSIVCPQLTSSMLTSRAVANFCRSVGLGVQRPSKIASTRSSARFASLATSLTVQPVCSKIISIVCIGYVAYAIDVKKQGTCFLDRVILSRWESCTKSDSRPPCPNSGRKNIQKSSFLSDLWFSSPHVELAVNREMCRICVDVALLPVGFLCG